MKIESLNNPIVIIYIIGPINRIVFSRMKYVQVTKKYYKIKRKKRKKYLTVKFLNHSFYCLIYCTFIVPSLKLSSGVFLCLCIIQI